MTTDDMRADWVYEVANGDTSLGFAEWAERKVDEIADVPACILTGAAGESEDDCTTHAHEPVNETWLKFDAEDDEDASHEANVTQTDRGYRVGWSNTAVGLVTNVDFDTLTEAHAWLERAGYRDFTA